jgi:hypothetical protein
MKEVKAKKPRTVTSNANLYKSVLLAPVICNIQYIGVPYPHMLLLFKL